MSFVKTPAGGRWLTGCVILRNFHVIRVAARGVRLTREMQAFNREPVLEPVVHARRVPAQGHARVFRCHHYLIEDNLTLMQQLDLVAK